MGQCYQHKKNTKMAIEIDDVKKSYEPEVQDVENLAGISMKAAHEGEQVEVLQKAFITSYQDENCHLFTQILGQFSGLNMENLNRILIVMRKEKAYIYRNYPVELMVKSKVDIESGKFVFGNQISDIIKVRFKDKIFELDVKDGDKIVWLFRIGWGFGLYFDFSGQIKIDRLWEELGLYYKKLKFNSMYLFLSNQDNFDALMNHGWFPFVQIIGNSFEDLRLSINDTKGIKIVEKRIINSFTVEKIDSITRYWWRNEIFKEKRFLISAGIDAYKKGGSGDIINCIKNLATEIEGIIRLDYHKMNKGKPNTNELKKYVSDRAKSNFSSPESLGFPDYFFNYLDKVFFRQFNIEGGDIRLSRHTVAHGTADAREYSKVRALQLILTLDQIYFYLS